MCGIVGAFSATRLGLLDDAARVAQAIDCLAHRGPDGRGAWISANADAFLGHRRLSIIDLAGGAQPLTNESARIHLAYNGEIYNYPALRAELLGRGHSFRTSTDGESALHSYEDRPGDFELTLRGMFAAAIIDEDAQALTLVRDRLGIKPLFFTVRGQTLLFASELKALLKLCEAVVLDHEALRSYLEWKFIPPPRTIYAGVYELPAGARLVARRRGAELALNASIYWQAQPHAAGEADAGAGKACPADEAALVDALDQVIRDAVLCHLESDVEVGALLSGGVDSSLIVAIAAQLSKRPLKTFCVSFREQGFDQLPFARTLAAHCGTQHHEEYADLDPRAFARTAADCFDQPFGDSSALACHAVCATAARKVRVALTGDGGDEVFCGYQRHLAMQDERAAARPATFAQRQLYRALAAGFSPEARFLRRLRAEQCTDPAQAYDDRERTCGLWLLRRLVPDDPRPAAAPAWLRPLKVDRWRGAALLGARGLGADWVRAVQHRDLTEYLPGDILQKVDRTSMAHGLECRPPLLDHHVVEFAMRVPAAMHITGGEPKYLLKKLAERYVPPELLYRKKRGFRVPIRRWFKAGLLDEAARDLRHGVCVERGLLDRRAVEWVLRRQRLPWFNLSSLLWSLWLLEHWARGRPR